MLKIDSQINRNFILFPINFENINMLRPSTDNESSRILKNLPESSSFIYASKSLTLTSKICLQINLAQAMPATDLLIRTQVVTIPICNERQRLPTLV